MLSASRLQWVGLGAQAVALVLILVEEWRGACVALTVALICWILAARKAR